MSLTTNSNGEVIVEGSQLFVSPGGRYVFSVSATDDNGTRCMSNGYVETERLFHFVEVKMDNLASITSSLASFKNEYLKNGVRFKALPSVNMPLMKNVYSRAEKDIFKSNVQTALASSQAAAHSPYCVAIGYVDHIAEKGDLTIVAICGEGTDGVVNVLVADIDTSEEFALWHDLDDTSDWFISCEFIPTDGRPIIPIGKESCTPELKIGFQFGYIADGHNICSPMYPDEATRYLMNEFLINVPQKIIYSAAIPMDSIKPVIPVCIALVLTAKRAYKYAHLSDRILFIRKVDSDDWYSGKIYERPSDGYDLPNPHKEEWDKKVAKRIAEAQHYSDDELDEGQGSGGYRNLNLMQYVDMPFEPGVYEIYYASRGIESNRAQVEIVFEK